jgi:hypothetical protein
VVRTSSLKGNSCRVYTVGESACTWKKGTRGKISSIPFVPDCVLFCPHVCVKAGIVGGYCNFHTV